MAEIPEPPRPFVGRRSHVDWFERIVRSHDHWHGPHYVEGPAGVGKTALLSYLVASRRDYRRTLWLDLAGPPKLDEVLIQIDDLIRRRAGVRLDEGGLVVVDHADSYDDETLSMLIRRITNYKLVRALIVATRTHRPNERSSVLKLASLTRDDAIELFDMLVRVEVSPEIRDQIIARSNGNPMLLKTQIGVLNTGGIRALGDALNIPIYEFDETAPADKVIEVAKPKIIIVTGEILAALQREPESIYQLPPRRFEEVLAELLEARGMKVELTQASKDDGRDIIASLETELGRILCLVEAKRYAKDHKVGVELVRQLYGVLCDHKATNAMLVTTSSFTKGAKDFQQRHEYEMSLKDYADILKWIQGYNRSGSGLILPS